MILFGFFTTIMVRITPLVYPFIYKCACSAFFIGAQGCAARFMRSARQTHKFWHNNLDPRRACFHVFVLIFLYNIQLADKRKLRDTLLTISRRLALKNHQTLTWNCTYIKWDRILPKMLIWKCWWVVNPSTRVARRLNAHLMRLNYLPVSTKGFDILMIFLNIN